MKNNKLFRLLLVTLLLAGAQVSAQDDNVPAMDLKLISAAR